MEEKFDISQVLLQITQKTSSIKFSNVATMLQRLYIFKNVDVLPSHLSKLLYLDQLMIGCFRCVTAKLLADQIEQGTLSHFKTTDRKKQKQLLKTIQIYCAKMGSLLKDNYHIFMREISKPKAMYIEFILFLIFVSSQSILMDLCQESKIIAEHLLSRFSSQGANLNNWACIIINFYITGMKISPSVFECLKRRFIKHSNIKNSTNSEKHSFRSALSRKQFCFSRPSTKKIINRKNSLFDSQNTGSAKKQIYTELKNIFTQRKNSSTGNFQNHNTKAKRINSTNSDSFYKEDSCLTRNTIKTNQKTFTIFRTSEQKNDNTSKTIEYALNNNKRKMMKITKLQISNKNLQIAKNQTHKFGKNNDHGSQIQAKLEASEWKSILSQMRNSANIENVNLRKRNFISHKKVQSSFEDINLTFQTDFKTERSNVRQLKQLKSLVQSSTKDRNRTGKGFWDFIEIREPEQMAIVKSVFNQVYYIPKQKKIRIVSKQLKGQFEDFRRHMDENKHILTKDNNDSFRLQMALSRGKS